MAEVGNEKSGKMQDDTTSKMQDDSVVFPTRNLRVEWTRKLKNTITIQLLKDMFGQHGEIESIIIRKTKAFVSFHRVGLISLSILQCFPDSLILADAASARTEIHGVNREELRGRRLYLHFIPEKDIPKRVTSSPAGVTAPPLPGSKFTVG
jgi:hypothetical protein